MWKDGSVGFHCFNCGQSMGMFKFIKTLDSSLADEYLAERAMNRRRSNYNYNSSSKEEPVAESLSTDVDEKIDQRKYLRGLVSVNRLVPGHPIISYIKKRRIPEKQWKRLYFTPGYNTWVNSHMPGSLNEKYDEPRLVLPMVNADGYVFGASGRGFKPGGLRYITTMFDPSESKVFGAECCDTSKDHFILEGQIDSLFFENAMALVGADLTQGYEVNKSKAVFVYDAEPRNREIVSRMEKAIQAGYKLVIWPKDVPGKDVNDMVLAGYDYLSAINNNIFQGLTANLKLAEWKRTRNA